MDRFLELSPIILAIAAILLNWLEHPRAAAAAGYASLLATQLGRLARALRRPARPAPAPHPEPR